MKILFAMSLTLLLNQMTWSLTKSQKDNLENRVSNIMERLDRSPLILESTDQVISIYQQIVGTTPTLLEVESLEALLGRVDHQHSHDHDDSIPLSHIVEQLLVYKNKKDHLTYEDVERNIKTLESLELNLFPSVGVLALEPIDEPVMKGSNSIEPISHTEDYRPYFGYLHAHSNFSDGDGTPREAYTMTRDEAKMDFFALTDHAEYLHFWPWKSKFKKKKRIANEFNEDGKFVALHGFEWSHPLLGHINIIHSKRFVSAITRPTMGLLMKWISRRPNSFARFNHPGRISMDRWPYEFAKFKTYSKALNNVVGIEMWNKGYTLSDYLENRGSYIDGKNALDNANLNGWFVGAVGGQDNHQADWGIRNDQRVGVWAKDLTREGIIEAYKGRRTFATEDKNAWVSFKINSSQMGSRLRAGTYELEIAFGDKDSEQMIEAQLVKNGEVIKTYIVDESQKIEDMVTGDFGDFIYVKAKQADGDQLLSSPIWFL